MALVAILFSRNRQTRWGPRACLSALQAVRRNSQSSSVRFGTGQVATDDVGTESSIVETKNRHMGLWRNGAESLRGGEPLPLFVHNIS